jgi:hypothetical protein
MELRAHVGADAGPTRHERFSFNFKARTAAGGCGLQEDAILTRTRFAVELQSRRRGEGAVDLASSPHAPLAEVGVVEVRGATYGADDSAPSCEVVATVNSAAFLPYHYGRQATGWRSMPVSRSENDNDGQWDPRSLSVSS